MLKKLLVSLALLFAPLGAFAQSSPNFTTNQHVLASEWNSEFSAKVDVNNGALSSPAITGGHIDNATIGGTIPAPGTFSSLSVVGAMHMGASLLDGSNVSFTGGSLSGLAWSGGSISGAVTANGGSVSGTSAFAVPIDLSTTIPTGGTTARTNAALAGDFVRATSFGAKFDGVRVASGGAMTAGSNVLTWTGGSFVASDVGKLVSVDGAGLNGRPLVATITGFTSATSVTLSTTALSTVSTSVLAWKSGYQGGPTVSAAGTGYAPGDLITLTGGTETYPGVLQVVGTKAITATVVSGGTGGTTGACTITGTTGNANGTTTLFQATGTVSGGSLPVGALTVTIAGEYRDPPTDATAEPVTSNCGLSGTTVALGMGVVDTLVRQPGAYSVRPSDPIAQGSTTGGGTGATFTGVWTNTGTFHYGTDNGTAVQAAINYCQTQVVNNAGGCTVLLPIGTGMTSTTLTVNKSNVSLYSLSRSTGFQQRNIASSISETFPTRLLYAGADNPGYMLTQVPLLADGHRLAGVDVVGIMFDCAGTQGCGGVSIRSTAYSTYRAAVNEPYPRAYTISGAVSSGTRTVVVTDATGVDVGQNVWIPNALSGTYVESISGNVITLSSTVYGTGLADGAPIYIGGEAWRLDVLGGLSVSDTQANNLWLYGRTSNSPGPCVTINGSALPGSPQFGNTSGNFFRDVGCVTGAGDLVDANNSDHNFWYAWSSTFVPNSFGPGAAFVGNGSLNVNNGSNRYNWFYQSPGRRGIILRGTSAGGFTSASVFNTLWWLISSSAPRLSVDTAGSAQACVSQDNIPAIGCVGTQGIQAQVTDSTAVGGNARGANAVDLQSTRTAATMVANGAQATIGGGINNTASGAQSTVPGGSGNVASNTASQAGGLTSTASGVQSFAFGTTATASGQNATAFGNAVTASGTGSFAFGVQTLADDYGAFCTSSGGINGGGSSETCRHHLRGTGNSTTAIQVTADNAAAGSANCANIPLDSVASLDIVLTVYDRTTPTVRNTFSWHEPQSVLWVGNTAGTTTYTASGSATTLSAGSLTTATVSATADTTNKCLNLSFTPPAANTDTLDVYATVVTSRSR